MDRASSLIFPGGRTLAGWWRQLAPVQPLELWIGYVFLHRLEASVQVQFDQPLDRLGSFVLQAIHLEETLAASQDSGVGLQALEGRLRLSASVLQRVLADLAGAGLIACEPENRWLTTERGRAALPTQTTPVLIERRMVFPFQERLEPTGKRSAPPHYMPVAECVGVPWQVDEDHWINVEAVRACIDQAADWKQAAGFPLTVQGLGQPSDSEAWRQIVVDRPERVLMAIVKTSASGTREVHGFAAKADGWTLYDRVPVLRLPETAWPEVGNEPSAFLCQEAWRNWCKQRQLPGNEVEICSVAYRAPRLEIQAPPRLFQRLQAAKSDLFKGEAWVLLGEGHLRTAAQLSVRTAT
ncbi:MAG: hypothetical protein HYX68_13525 [Planctomycetes bacterium]|nr:hypothetical protein [Planctomycetota bacterium]